METCNILNCENSTAVFSDCEKCELRICETCADNLVIGDGVDSDGVDKYKQICPKCTFGGNFEGIFPGISKFPRADSVLSKYKGLYRPLDKPNYKYAVYMTRKHNNLILVFRLDDGESERFMKFSLFIKNKLVMIKLFCPLNISGQNIEQELILEETFDPDKKNPVFSSLTKTFKDVFNYFQRLSTARHFDTQPIFGAEWWKLMIGWYEDNKDYIQLFRPNKSRRRGSKSVRRRRKLRSKSKSRKRSPKPRRR